MNASTTPKPATTLTWLRRSLLASTAIDAIAIGAGMINLAKAPVFVPTARSHAAAEAA